MLRLCALLLCCVCSVASAENKPLLLVTPKGTWQIDVIDGIPGTAKPTNYTVIVQGFGGGETVPIPPDTNPNPDPDPIVAQVATLSSKLSSKAEGTAAAALVNSLAKMGLKDKALQDALLLSAPIVDTQLKSGTRITDFAKAATAITVDPAKLIAGLTKQWQIDPTILSAIHSAAMRQNLTPEESTASEAFDIAAIFAIIQMIIQLLQSLGII